MKPHRVSPLCSSNEAANPTIASTWVSKQGSESLNVQSRPRRFQNEKRGKTFRWGRVSCLHQGTNLWVELRTVRWVTATTNSTKVSSVVRLVALSKRIATYVSLMTFSTLQRQAQVASVKETSNIPILAANSGAHPRTVVNARARLLFSQRLQALCHHMPDRLFRGLNHRAEVAQVTRKVVYWGT